MIRWFDFIAIKSKKKIYEKKIRNQIEQKYTHRDIFFFISFFRMLDLNRFWFYLYFLLNKLLMHRLRKKNIIIYLEE